MAASFSTGFPQLDKYIGGVTQGDSFLWITDRNRHLHPLIHRLVAYCRESRIPVVTILASSTGLAQYYELLSKASYKVDKMPARKAFPVASVRSFLTKNTKRACVIVDDVSVWKRFFRTEKDLVKFFQSLFEVTAKNEGLLVTSVLRSEYTPQTLTFLKDYARVALELVEREGELYCIPVSTFGRYVPYRLFPLNIRRETRDSTLGKLIGSEPAGYPERISEKVFRDIRNDIFSENDRYKRLFENTSEPMMLIHAKSGLREVNQALVNLVGYKADEMISVPLVNFISSKHKYNFLRSIITLRKKNSLTLRFELIKKSGRSLPVEAHCSSVGNGWYLCFLEDLTKRHWERELQKTLDDAQKREESFRSMVESTSQPIAVLVGNRLDYANSAFANLLRVPQGQKKKNISELFDQESLPELRTQLKNLKTQTSSSSNLWLRTMDGQRIFCSCSFDKVSYYGKDEIQLSLSDISETKSTVDGLQKQLQRYTTLLQHSLDALCVVEGERIVFANAAFLNMTGHAQFEEIFSKDLSSIIPSTHLKKVKRQFESITEGKKTVFESVVMRKDGSLLDVRMDCRTISFDEKNASLIHFTDVAAEKQLERELQNSQFENTIINKTLSLLHQSTAKTSGSISLREVLLGILPQLPFQGGGMFTLDSSGKEFHLSQHLNFPEKLAASLAVLPKEEGFAGIAVKTHEAHVFTISSYPSYLPYRAVFEDNGIRTLALLPLVSRESVVGILLLISHHEIREEHPLDIYTSLGKMIGTAIESATQFRALQEVLEQRETLIEALPYVVYSCSPDGCFYFVSSGIEDLTGYAPKDFYRNRSLWLSIVHPDDKKDLLVRMANLNNLPDTLTNEYRILPKGKAKYRWVSDSALLLRNEGNTVMKINGLLMEINSTKTRTKRESEPHEETVTA
jgi:PAS domain S-box-containing protein